jgi:hypothetical protein
VTSDGVLFIRIYALAHVVLALDCLRVAMTGGVPMPEWTHGQAIYLIPAEVWAVASIIPPLMVFVFVRRRLWVTALAALVAAVVQLSIGVFAADADFGFVLSRIAFGAGLLWLGIAVSAAAEATWGRWLTWARHIEARIRRDD